MSAANNIIESTI